MTSGEASSDEDFGTGSVRRDAWAVNVATSFAGERFGIGNFLVGSPGCPVACFVSL